MDIERGKNFLETLSKDQVLLLYNVLNFDVKTISWDLDQILSKTEEPVKEAFDAEFGTNYKIRKIDRWRALTAWAVYDRVLSEKEASRIEDRLWSNPDILLQAPPVEIMRRYSRSAHNLGLDQFVVTSRPPELKPSTFKWLSIHYPWIPSQNILIRRDSRIDGDGFKVLSVSGLTPNVHFDRFCFVRKRDS